MLTFLVHLDGGFDLLELVDHQRVPLISICMVVREGAESLRVLALADEPTGGLWDEPDQEELEDRRDSLEDGGDTPGPVALDASSAERRPRSTVQKAEMSEMNALP